MDQSLSSLAAAAGDALVAAMVSDSWASLRDRAARIFGAGDPGDERSLTTQLDDSRTRIRSGQQSADLAGARWHGKFEAILERHPDIQSEVRSLLAACTEATSVPKRLEQHAIAGNRSTINQAGRDIDNSKKSTSYGGPLAVFAVIAVVAILGGGIWAAKTAIVWLGDQTTSTSITKDSTCADYLAVSTEEREHAVKTIGVQLGASGAGNPMARLNVDYSCGEHPTRAVGKVIAVQNY